MGLLSEVTSSGVMNGWRAVGVTETSPGDVAVAALVVLIGGLLVVANSDRGRRVTDRARYNPSEVVIYGVGVNVGFILVLLVLVIFGLAVLALPLLLVYAVLAVAATVVGYLAVGRLVAGNWWLVVAVGAVAAAIAAAVPYLGTVTGLAVTSVGFGMLVLEYNSTYDREVETELAGPGNMRSHIGVSTKNGTVTRFQITVTYWTGVDHETVVRYVHDPTGNGSDVTEDGLRIRIHGEAGSIDVEDVTEPIEPDDAVQQAFEHLETNLDEIVREFEHDRGIEADEAEWSYEMPLEASELRSARETLGEQRETVTAYLATAADSPQAGWLLEAGR